MRAHKQQYHIMPQMHEAGGLHMRECAHATLP